MRNESLIVLLKLYWCISKVIVRIVHIKRMFEFADLSFFICQIYTRKQI